MKSGGHYTVKGLVRLEANDKYAYMYDVDKPGELPWVREKEEMEDGRFTLVGQLVVARADNVADHGHPFLSEQDVDLLLIYTRWVQFRFLPEKKAGDKRRFDAGLPTYADIKKSRLFWRMRSRKMIYKHAPPTCFSCPWYELLDNHTEEHATFDGGFFKMPASMLARMDSDRDGTFMSIAQCTYQILDTIDENRWHVAFGAYRFNVRRGPSEKRPEVTNWFIRLAPVSYPLLKEEFDFDDN